MIDPREFNEPEPDDLRRADLAEYNLMWGAVADALYEWHSDVVHDLHRTLRGSEHGVGSFLDDLAARGYRVEPIDPGPPFDRLLGASAD